jgi:hypothetical protein
MEILTAIKAAGEVVITEVGKEAYRSGMKWQNWSVENALISGYLEETETAAVNREAQEAEFRRIVGE